MTSLRLSIFLLALASEANAQNRIPNQFPFPNDSGILRTFNTNGDGSIDLGNPFFQSLGTNGRSCGSCHKPDQGWSLSADRIRRLFELTAGKDPVFRTNDGSNCDHDIDVSSVAGRRAAYSLLNSRGIFRIALPVPAGAEFEVVSVANPYGCNETDTLSMYRRPLPSTNLKFLSAVMWDGRESTPPDTQKITFLTNPSDLKFDLAHQSVDATNGHAQASHPLTPAQQKAIVDFETGLFTAQSEDYFAGSLGAGPKGLMAQPFFIGINDPLGGNPFGTAFTTAVFQLFSNWANPNPRRGSIARGEALFNSKPIQLTGVGGLNDDLNQPAIVSTCGICHDSPNVGNHSLPVPLNIGVADVDSSLGTNYLPVITLRNRVTKQTVQTTDPGRAMITGRWNDIGKFKGPILRGLAARAPYFHNGSATTLADVLEFYDKRFKIGFTQQEKADLTAFLSAL